MNVFKLNDSVHVECRRTVFRAIHLTRCQSPDRVRDCISRLRTFRSRVTSSRRTEKGGERRRTGKMASPSIVDRMKSTYTVAESLAGRAIVLLSLLADVCCRNNFPVTSYGVPAMRVFYFYILFHRHTVNQWNIIFHTRSPLRCVSVCVCVAGLLLYERLPAHRTYSHPHTHRVCMINEWKAWK